MIINRRSLFVCIAVIAIAVFCFTIKIVLGVAVLIAAVWAHAPGNVPSVPAEITIKRADTFAVKA